MTEPGESYGNPLRVARTDIDVSAVRAHCREHHRPVSLPRSNLDVAAWHAAQHHRYTSAIRHVHRGPWTIVTRPGNPRGVGYRAHPMGWYTGQDMVTKAELDAEFRAKSRGWDHDRYMAGRAVGSADAPAGEFRPGDFKDEPPDYRQGYADGWEATRDALGLRG
jgi:hypothetical protein